MNILTGILKEKCAVCRQGRIFEKSPFISFRIPRMKTACPHCGHVFEQESGFFWGAMFVSYALAVVEIIAVLLITQPFFTETLDNRMIWLVALSILLLSSFNFRKSRTIWLYIFAPRRIKQKAGRV